MSAADRQLEERDASPSESFAEVSDDEAADVGARELSPSDQGWNTAVATATPVRARPPPAPPIPHPSRLGVSVSIRRSAAVIEGAMWPAGAGAALTGLRVH